jgi:UDP-GlcNAc:undecaprenyl-phosphate/decaprenyl-phosphate GlcNAc-1-phosphate transferase
MKMLALLAGSAFLIALVTSLLITPFVRKLATHVGMVDELGERRMHEIPRPRIGGIAIYLGYALALFVVTGIAITKGKFGNVEVHALLGLLFGGTLIVCVGLWDDIMSMRPRFKFAAQIAVASLLMLYGSDFRIHGIGNPFDHGRWIDFPLPLEISLTLVWYLGMMNAINFVDGLDGLLAGLTAISGTFLFAIAITKGHAVVAVVLIALVGAVLGFLPYNFNPAKIILGDSGALFIGFIFATASVIGDAKSAVTISLVLPALVLALPIVDTAATIVRRTRAGRKITDADREHFHHQLVFRFGLDVRQAVLLIYAVCFVLGATALVLSGTLGGPFKAAKVF